MMTGRPQVNQTPLFGIRAEEIAEGLSCLVSVYPAGKAPTVHQSVSSGGLKIAVASEGGGLTRCGDIGEVRFDRHRAYMFRQAAGTETAMDDLSYTDGWFRFFGLEVKPAWVARQHDISGHDPMVDWAFEALQREFCLPIATAPAYRRIVEEVRCCRYIGASRRLFLESRALELLVMIADAHSERPGKAPTTTASEAAKLDEASQIIASDAAAHLSIAGLAGAVGLNTMKLKRGFKERFGQTIHQFIIDRRLDEARALLGDTDLQIAQIAYRVGYTPGHFSQVFRSRFGESPSALRRGKH